MGFNSAFKGLNYITHKTTIKIHKIYFGGVCVRKLYQGNKSQTRQHYIRRTFKFIYQTFSCTLIFHFSVAAILILILILILTLFLQILIQLPDFSLPSDKCTSVDTVSFQFRPSNFM